MKHLILFIALVFSASVYACEIYLEKSDVAKLSFLSVEQLEDKFKSVVKETGEVIPFGYANQDWKTTKSLLKKGDQLAQLQKCSNNHCENGIAIIRGNCATHFFVLSYDHY